MTEQLLMFPGTVPPVPDGPARRDAGVVRVLSKPDFGAQRWREKAIRALHDLARTREDFTSDDLRSAVHEEPHHPNAWGAVFLICARRGWIEKTNMTRNATRTAAHAHANPVWRSRLNKAPP